MVNEIAYRNSKIHAKTVDWNRAVLTAGEPGTVKSSNLTLNYSKTREKPVSDI